MRAGWTAKLRSLLHAADPVLHVIAEVLQVVSSDIKDTRTEWSGADTVTGQVLDSGGVTLFRSTTNSVVQSTDDGTEVSALSRTLPADGLIIKWSGSNAESRELANLVARLHPRPDLGSPKEVSQWRAALYRIVERGPDEDRIVASLIAGPIAVTATGETASDVTFDFTFGEHVPVVGPAPRYIEKAGSTGVASSNPETLVRIWAVKSDGTSAGNVAWMADSTLGALVTGSGYEVTHHSLSDGATSQGQERGGDTVYLLDSTVANMPRFTLNRATYSAATVTFTTNGPTGLGTTYDHEIIATAETPGDSSVLFEIDSGAGGWVTCADGDIIGQDNSASGGSDLSGVTPASSYNIRVTLTPATGGLQAPVVRRFGVQEIQSTDLAGVATVQNCTWGVNPQTLKGEITRADVRILKTGERDYLDYGSQILSQHHIGDIVVRVWIGDPTYEYLARSEWMHLDSFEIEDYTNEDTAHALTCVSPLRRLRRTIPPFVATTANDGTRQPIDYLNVTIKAAAADIVDGQVGLPGRFRGPLLEDTTVVSKTVRETDAKDELDRLAYLAGWGIVTSQGRVKGVRMMTDNAAPPAPVQTFMPGDYTPVSIGPGYSARVDEFFVPYGWTEDADGRNGSFGGDARYFNATAVEKLGGAGLDTTDTLDDETAKWISGETLAQTVAARVPKHFGNGLILWRIRSNYAQPQLEPGDPVVVVTDRFVARSPVSDQEIRGPKAGHGVVASVSGPWGRDIEIWITSIDDVVLSTGTVTRSGYRAPLFRHAVISFEEDGSVRFKGQLLPGLSLRASISTSAFPSTTTVGGETLQTTDSDGNFDFELAATWDVKDTAYVSALGYEFADGTGAVSDVWRSQDANPAGELYNWRWLYDVPSAGKVKGKWTRGSAVAFVFVWENTLATPLADDTGLAYPDKPFPDDGDQGEPTAALAVGTDEYVFDVPTDPDVTFVQIEARDADLRVLHVYRKEIKPRAVFSVSDIPSNAIGFSKLKQAAQTFGSDISFSAADWDTVDWGAGSIWTGDGTEYSITAGSTGNLSASGMFWIYLDTAVSTTALQITNNVNNAVGDGKILVAGCRRSSLGASGGMDAGVFPATGILGLNGDNINPDSVRTSHIQVNQLDGISANLGTVTSGTIDTLVLVAAESFTAANPVFDGEMKVYGGFAYSNFSVYDQGGGQIRAKLEDRDLTGYGGLYLQPYMGGGVKLYVRDFTAGPPSNDSGDVLVLELATTDTGGAPMIGLFGATPVAQPSAYTPSNVTTDRAYDANATTVAELADVLGTLIADLQGLGAIG